MKIIAHSIKNLREARVALKRGVDYLEVDVGKRILLPKFVIAHSPIQGILGIGPILASLLIPPLRDKLFLDLKNLNISITFVQRFASLLAKFKVRGVRICGRDWSQISKLSHGTNLLPFYTLRTRNHIQKIKKMLPKLTRPAGLSVNYKLIDENFMEEFRNLSEDLQIWAWTVNDLKEAKRLVKLGVDGIISDNYLDVVKKVKEA